MKQWGLPSTTILEACLSACRREREFNFNSNRAGLSATIISPTFFYICRSWLRDSDRFPYMLSDENFYGAKLEEILEGERDAEIIMLR